MTRDDEVLEILRTWSPAAVSSPAGVCRALNHVRPRPWCPVEPPRPGERCAVVPPKSRWRVMRVLDRLVRQGLVARYRIFKRKQEYALKEVVERWGQNDG